MNRFVQNMNKWKKNLKHMNNALEQYQFALNRLLERLDQQLIE